MEAPSDPALQPEDNFGGNQRWYTRRYQPSSEAAVLDILARHSGQTIRVLGSKHSWSDIAADAAVSIDMRRLDGVELIERNGEPMVRVGAGCRLQDLLDWLHERTDRTLPTLGAIKKQTISGAISTGTHGSGRQSLSHYVARIRAAVFDAASGQPAIREFSQGPELEAARCGLGCMGVILAVELPTVPKFKIAETVRIRQSLEEILGLYADQPLTQFFWAPYSWVWVTFERRPVGKPRLSSWDRAKARVFRAVNLVFVDVVFHLFVIASRMAGLPGVRSFFRIVPHLLLKNRERIDDAERVLTMAHDLFRHEEMELFVREADLARAMEVVRTAIEVCAGTATPVPADVEKQLREVGTYDALLALRGSYVHHYLVFCRRVMPEDTLVSMAASADQPYYSVSIFTYDRPERRQPYYELCGWLARSLLQLVDARLHWGKHFPLEHQDIARLYPRLAEFRALCRTVDPAGVLRNGYTARVLDLPPGPGSHPQLDASVTEMASSKGTREHQHMSADTSLPLRGSCECGACSFEVHTSPKARFRCHCLICQAFNGKPFADVVAVRAKDVVLKNAGNISFKKYRPPPNFNRGVCRTCGKPVVEVAGAGPFKVMFIPASNFEPEARLPPVRMDIFYHRRVLDMPDSLPKYSGYFPSQWAVGKMIMSGL